MKKLKSQSGRSMVEMLGVLAIIGVLSVGGIAGYSLSMRRHRANGVVDLISKYALITYNQCQQKILNEENTSLSSCSEGNISEFENADVGALPAGVTRIGFLEITNDATSGADIVNLYATFSDKKLLQAVTSISGEHRSGSDVVLFYIKQN